MVRRIAFVSGLILGSGISAFVLGAVLTYLFTGKVMAVSANRSQGFRLTLLDMDMLREGPVTIAEESTI